MRSSQLKQYMAIGWSPFKASITLSKGQNPNFLYMLLSLVINKSMSAVTLPPRNKTTLFPSKVTRAIRHDTSLIWFTLPQNVSLNLDLGSLTMPLKRSVLALPCSVSWTRKERLSTVASMDLCLTSLQRPDLLVTMGCKSPTNKLYTASSCHVCTCIGTSLQSMGGSIICEGF